MKKPTEEIEESEQYRIVLVTLWKCSTCGYEDRREEFCYEPSTGRKLCAICVRMD